MKQIIVPKNIKAQQALTYDNATNEQLLVWELTDEEYNHLNDLNVFEIINDKCNTLIDDYEDEEIAYSKLQEIINIFDRNNDKLLNKFHQYILEAINRKTSLHFYF